jgi:hydroxymethylpyrimidine/phosphomethylpyrimidine kinase
LNAELQVDSVPPVVLTIAGFDPSSGAGITADLKVFAAHRLYGVSAITALTVQSTQGVRRTEPVSPEILAETLACLAADVEISGVKIGMLATAGNVLAVSRFLTEAGIPSARVVLDPVIRSSSGRELLEAEGLKGLKSELLKRVGWVTPNREELATLVDRPVSGSKEVPAAAADLQSAYPGLNVVVTAGDADPPNDFLRTSEGSEHWLSGERIDTSATHGTGCTFSSALLAGLVIERETPETAARKAKRYVAEAMRSAYKIGKGAGPLHHLYRF